MRHMSRVAATVISLAAMFGAGMSTAPPATAAAPVTAGDMLSSGPKGNRYFCTVGFPDPIHANVVYTASHCYRGNREVRVGTQRIGTFRPELVYNKKLDLVAIHLYDGIPSRNVLCLDDGCHPIATPRMPAVGEYVCKYGSTTGETCGAITAVWDREFSMDLYCDNGDSGGPIYQRGADGNVHVIGMVTATNKDDPRVVYGTSITSISALLRDTWGPGWSMF